MRLPMEAFQTGVSMANLPGANPMADAIKGVVQRYKDLRAQRETMSQEITLHKEKTKADYQAKRELFGNFQIPENTEVSGYDEAGFVKGYKPIDLRNKILKQVEEKGYESLNPNQKFLFDKVYKMEQKVGEVDQAFNAINTPSTPTVKSPFAEYPDAFQESGVWKVIRNGKTYKIEE